MKNVFIPAGDGGVGAELLDQLRIFGISVHEFTDAPDLARLASARGGGVLLMEADCIDREPAFFADLARLRDELGDKLHLLFYADRDDFRVRLRAVRAGGEGFFLLPVDAARLAEKVDSLLLGADRPPYHVLIVDDDTEEVAFDALILQEAGMITSVATAPDQVIPILVDSRPEIILMDLYMPQCSGPELATLIRQNEAFAAIPIVFLSIERDLETQVRAIACGGDDFLEKPIKPEYLVASVATRAERTRSVRFFMERDSLTGLLNHTNLIERLCTDILRAQRAGVPLSFAMIDLDHFKDVNDRFGHLTGDQVLRSLSRLIGERVRRTDAVGRYGGEEFGIILQGSDPKQAFSIMDELRQGFRGLSHRAQEQEFNVTFSCGIASWPEYPTAAEIMEAADRSLYRAKGEGRDRVIVADSRDGEP